jgi:hypothetical protein
MKYLKLILIGITTIVILVGIMFSTGALNILYKNTIGVKTESANRNIYKENKSHVEGMVKDLSSYKMQYELTYNEKEKQAIRSRIINDFANFDLNKIDNVGLQNFLVEMRGY